MITNKTTPALPPVERDEAMDRTYIPMPGGWEVQTKGKGSTFRLCDTKSGDRWPVLDHFLHEALERMAREVRSASAPAQGAPRDVVRAAVSTMLALGSDFPREELNLRDVELVAQFVAAPSAPAEQPQERPALVSALRGLLASLSRDQTEQELRAAAHEFTVRADRLAVARTRGEDVDG